MQSEPSIRKLQQEIYRGNLARLRSEVFDFGYDTKLLTQQISITKVLQAKIRQMYLMAGVHPFHFCSYATFAKVFPPPNIHEAYKAENLNIIDLHLRYHQYIHEKLTLFKWVPSLVVLAITRFNPIGLIFPLVYTHAVDHYFSDFLTWKYSRDKIINIRGEFTPKLSKQRTAQIFQDEFSSSTDSKKIWPKTKPKSPKSI